MNDAQLNGAQIGSSGSAFGVYLRGALTVFANGVGKFVPYGIRDFIGRMTPNATSVAKFGATFNMFGATKPAVVKAGVVFRLIKAFGTAVATVVSVGKAAVGVAVRAYGATSGFVISVWTARINVALNAQTESVAIVSGTSGLQHSGYGEVLAVLDNLEAQFTTFGASAPDERHIIVQQEDRKVTVV